MAAQYRSAQRLAAELPDAAAVLPTHGSGSLCAATQSEATSSTIGEQKRLNPALTRDEHRLAAQILAGLDAWPAYYAHMARANLGRAGAADLTTRRGGGSRPASGWPSW